MERRAAVDRRAGEQPEELGKPAPPFPVPAHGGPVRLRILRAPEAAP
jgi:hypothetical protein